MIPHLQNQMILAPLTRGGNLPFRRLCADFGMTVSMSEMVYARFLLRGSDRIERARLRRAPNEKWFGVQIATNNAEEGRRALQMAQEAGADFVDLNCGCPIHEATRRGLGSALLRSPGNLARLVEGMTVQASIPLSVKVRLGYDANTINVHQIVRELGTAGAAAVTIHGRTAIQGYSKASNWEMIRQIVEESNLHECKMPIIGNGDILTHYEAQRRLEESGVHAIMVGRGALIKPWIFQEFQQQKSWEPDLAERVSIYRRLTSYMKEHFGDDERGRRKAWTFLPWHFDFLARYMELPEEKYGNYGGPLIQMRVHLDEDRPPLAVLLSNRCIRTHDRIAAMLWTSDSDQDAVSKFASFAESADFEEIQNTGHSELVQETKELANIRKDDGRWHKRQATSPKPKRTPDEITAIRAERAAKKARIASENGETG